MSFETFLLDCIVTAVISVCIKRKHLSKLVNFCVAILTLKMEENTQHFWHIMLYYFKKGKNETEMKKKKDLCSAGRRCRVWLNVSKVVCKVSCCRLLAGQCSTVGQTGWSWRRSDWDINWEQSTLYHVGDGRHTQISKSIKLLVKMKKVSFILWKKTKWPF